MKNLIKTLALSLSVIFLASTSSMASDSKAAEKAKTAVENGAPDDWKLMATQAKKLIQRNTDMATAKAWLESSISIKADPYNLEIMGDYYAKNNLADQAVSYYVKSINMTKAAGNSTQALQQKLYDTKFSK
mgnify:CR=1 FL=1